MQLRGSGDRDDPRLLRKQPGEGDLCACSLLPGCDFAERLDDGLIRFAIRLIEAGDGVAEVVAVEGGTFVYGASEEAPAQWAEGDEANAEFFECRQDLILRLSPPQRIFALEGSDGLDCVCATDRICSCFREAEVLDLAFCDQLFDSAGDVFDWDVRVDSVLIEQIDDISLEALERGVSDLPDVLGPAVQACRWLPAWEAELGCDDDLIAEGREGFAYEFFVRERAVGFGGVKESDAAVEGGTDECDCLLFLCCGTVGEA